MFGSYIKIALRSLFKNKLYAIINVLGLAIGLAMYLLSGLITDYERGHDHMFDNRDRIHTVATVSNPAKGRSQIENQSTYMALKPLLDVKMPELAGSSRGVGMELLMKGNDKGFYEYVTFVDDDFTRMFNFKWLHGSPDSVIGSNQIVLSASKARQYFNRTDIVGETLILSGDSGDYPLMVVGVIEDIPGDSHFNQSLMEVRTLGMFSHMRTIDTFFPDLQPDENWGWLNDSYWTYLMTDGDMSTEELHDRVNEIYKSSVAENVLDNSSSLNIRPLSEANLATWYSVGLPVIDIIEYLGLLVLIIAIINYTNLATAQNMGRFREVGMRKTLGASRNQLLIQFLIECQSIVFIAMILSLTVIELTVPIFNGALDKVLTIDYGAILPWLIGTTLIVGLLAGGWPALVITRTSASEAMNNALQRGRKGGLIRSVMIGVQFVISIIMLGLVFVVYAQNQQVIKASEIFPKSQIITLNRMQNDKLLERLDVLRREIQALDGVEITAASSQVPFVQQNWGWSASREKGDMINAVDMNNMFVTPEFTTAYNIPIIAGRPFSAQNRSDYAEPGSDSAHVLVNELAVERLGFASSRDAIGQSFYIGTSEPYQLTIIGVMENRNLLGLQNPDVPFVYRWRDTFYRQLTVRLEEGATIDTIADIESIWAKINPEFPIDWSFLDDQFDRQFRMMRAVNLIFTGFSALALALALFGLFGLAAFMARQRTREIGLRKVLGASTPRLVRMLILQFSRPVIVALLVALPLAWLAGQQYLRMFADRIDYDSLLIITASLVAILLSWSTIAFHAYQVARANPIKSLRYE